jgi:hypothetical protein
MDDENKVDGENKQPEEGKSTDFENRITDLVAQSKAHFLRDAIRELREQRKIYSLEEEFAKTKKNRSLLVPLVVSLVVVIFVLAAIGVTYYIQQNSRNIQIDITAFEDVNLRDLLDVSKKNETKLKGLRQDLEGLKSEQAAAILGVRRDATNRIEILANRSLSERDRQEEIKKIRDEETRRVDDLNGQYKQRIQKKEGEIAAVQKEIDAYDSRMLEQAREQEAVLNNQLRLFEIERANLTKSYDDKIRGLTAAHSREINSLEKQKEEIVALLKNRHASEIAGLKQSHAKEIEDLIKLYNPTFTGRAGDLLKGDMDRNLLSANVTKSYDDILSDENVLANSDFQRMRSTLQEFSLIVDRLQEVSYINSVPSALNQLEYKNKVLVRDYEILWEKLVNVVKEKNATIAERDLSIAYRDKIIDQLNYGISSFTKNNRENGYILDPRNTKGIVVYLNDIYNVKNGTIGYVFRRDDEFIGTIRFSVNSDLVTASLEELSSKDRPLEPFDKILIQIQ